MTTWVWASLPVGEDKRGRWREWRQTGEVLGTGWLGVSSVGVLRLFREVVGLLTWSLGHQKKQGHCLLAV